MASRHCDRLWRASRLVDSRPGWRHSKGTERFGSPANMWMRRTGLFHAAGAGMFNVSPVLRRSVAKLERVVAEALERAGAQRIHCCPMGARPMWEHSGRWHLLAADMFALKDRNGAEFCLQPTHEEAVTSMVAASSPLSEHQLPLWLFQMSDKFRDEMNPRHGLLRARVFRMKDLYTFDTCEASAATTYDRVETIYSDLLKEQLALPAFRVSAASGAMGGSTSHEFHIASAAGQDTVLYCPPCDVGLNSEMAGDRVADSRCGQCGRPHDVVKSYEVAHTFMLGTHYSQSFGALYQPDDDGRSPSPLFMCCYGIGTTRLLAAAVDSLSTSRRMRWPHGVAPFRLVVVPPKRGSKEHAAGLTDFAVDVAHSLNDRVDSVKGDVLLDDRTNMTIGRRVSQAKQMGYPYALVVGRAANRPQPALELIETGGDNKTDLTHMLSHAAAFDFLRSIR